MKQTLGILAAVLVVTPVLGGDIERVYDLDVDYHIKFLATVFKTSPDRQDVKRVEMQQKPWRLLLDTTNATFCIGDEKTVVSCEQQGDFLVTCRLIDAVPYYEVGRIGGDGSLYFGFARRFVRNRVPPIAMSPRNMIKQGMTKKEALELLGRPPDVWVVVMRSSKQKNINLLYPVDAEKRPMPADQMWIFEYRTYARTKFCVHFANDSVSAVVDGPAMRD